MSSVSRPRLVIHDSHGTRVAPIDKTVFTIGRADGHDLQLDDPKVSRDHAEIVTAPDGYYYVRDHHSRAGTLLNGSPITEARLDEGDRLECGRGGPVLVFVTADRPDTRSAAAAGGEFRHITRLFDSLREMGSERVLDEVLALVLDSAIEASGAERGFVMLDEHGSLEMRVARGEGGVPLATEGFAISRKIPEKVFRTGEVTVIEDLLEGEMAEVHQGTVALGIRHVLCVPLRVVRYVARHDVPSVPHVIGVLYLDSRERGRLLSSPARLEIEALAAEAAVAIENARLYEEAIEKARQDQELRIASNLQQALLPEPRRSGPFFEAVGTSLPSRAIGGDFFDYQLTPCGEFAFSLGDITGKGPPAALLAALVQGLLAAQALVPIPLPPEEGIDLINRVLLSRRIESRYVTVFHGQLTETGRLTYCNAGQTPPLLFSGGRVAQLETGGTLVGAFTNAEYDAGEVQLHDGDTLVLYSDGISEAVNRQGDPFGEEGVETAVRGVIDDDPDVILKHLFAAVAAYGQGAPPGDDLTAVVLRYRTPRA